MGINTILLNSIGYIYGCLQTSLYDILKDIFFKMLVYQEKYMWSMLKLCMVSLLPIYCRNNKSYLVDSCVGESHYQTPELYVSIIE